jgi:hypothetical protein
VFSRKTVSSQRRNGAGGSAGDQARLGVRQPEEVQVLVGGGQLVERAEDVAEREPAPPVVQQERGLHA